MGKAVLITCWQNISTLDFQLRLQQFIELRREKRLFEARRHAQVCLVPHTENHTGMVFVAAGLLAFPPDTRVEPYKVCHFVCSFPASFLLSSYSSPALLSALLSADHLRPCIPKNDGHFSHRSSFEPIMNFSPFRRILFCTRLFLPASLL